MVEIAVAEQAQIAGKSGGANSELPYAPSWVDRFTAWVEQLPLPAWLFYLAMALVLSFIRTVVGWSDGSYPVGTVFPVHIVTASLPAYLLLVLHYLDDRAAAALTTFRPVLNVDAAGYDRLRYQLTTMPARLVLLLSIVGFVFGATNLHYLAPEAQLQLLKLFTSPTASITDTAIGALEWMMTTLFIYHTVRQLRLVSRIYTQHTDVNIFETGPLYALSRISAITSVALLFISYMFATFWANWQFNNGADASVAIFFLFLSLVIFVWPLVGAHRLLQEHKDRRKSEVARQMEAVTDELHRRTKTGDYTDMGNMNDAIDSLIKEQGVLSKVSTWPWDPETVRVVVTAILLPVGLWIITRVLERLGF